MEGNRPLSTLVGVRLSDEDYGVIKAFADQTGRTVASVTRQLLNRALSEGEIDAADLPEPSVADLLQRRRPRTRAENVACVQLVYDQLVDLVCNIAERSRRDAVMLCDGVGEALQTTARQLAEIGN